jgi:acyl-coenzyme A thioesterase PaaI-like protein
MDTSHSSDGQVEHRDALREAVRSTRALVLGLRIADAPSETLERVRSLIDEANELLAPHRVDGLRAQSGLRFEYGEHREFEVNDLATFFPYSPVVGPLNALSPPVSLWLDGNTARGKVTLPAQFTGPPGSVHGGVIALIFDELLGAACIWSGLGAFTGTLSIRYEKFTAVESEIELAAWIDRTEGRKVFAVGEMRVDGVVTARAHGIFIQATLGAN